MKLILMTLTIIFGLTLLAGCANSYQPYGTCPYYKPASTTSTTAR